MDIEELKEKARRIRLATINAIHVAGTGHAGGALSIADLLAVLYFDEMRVRPTEPDWQERDRFVQAQAGRPPLPVPNAAISRRRNCRRCVSTAHVYRDIRT